MQRRPLATITRPFVLTAPLLSLLLLVAGLATLACGPVAQPAPEDGFAVVMPAPQQEEATPEPTGDSTPRPTHCFNVIRVEGEFQALCPHSLTIIPTPEGGFPPMTKYPKPGDKYPKLGSGLEWYVREAEERALAAAGGVVLRCGGRQ